MRPSFKSTPSTQRRRSSASDSNDVKQILHEIREKRLSADAPIKGLFPQRTPSISASFTSRPDQEAPIAGPPILSLTKLDFELLREWDWKKRQKRLETWTEGLDLRKPDRGSTELIRETENRAEPASFAEAVKAKSEKLAKTKGHHRTGLILKRELENITGMRVRPIVPDGAPQKLQPHRTNRTSNEAAWKTFGQPTASQRKGSKRRGGPRASLIRHQEQLDKADTELEKIVDKARAIELKSTFGNKRGWGQRKQSLRTSKDISEQTAATPLEEVSQGGDDSHHHKHHKHHHQRHFQETKTDEEEKQPPTSYASHTSRGHTQTADDASSILSPTDSVVSIGVPALIKSMQESDNDDDEGESSDEKEDPKGKSDKFGRPQPPIEYHDTSFGGIKLVSRSSHKPEAKDKKGEQFYMTFDDTELGLGLAKTEHLRIRFFKEDGPAYGRSEQILAREKAEKEERARELKLQQEQAEAERLRKKTTLKSFGEITQFLQSDMDEGDKEKYAEKLAKLEKSLMQIPGVGPGYRIEVEQVSRKPSVEVPDSSRVSRRQHFTRPPRRVWYTPLPLAIKKYYRTNWKRIRFDVRGEMRKHKFWPKLWINFEESHPKKMFELIHYKLAVKQFDSVGFNKGYDWEKGIHPDYVDWVLEDVIPHAGKYFYDEEGHDAVRKASLEDGDLELKDWFTKPPRYLPASPLSPPFDQFDFCGYGNRENSYFLDFTLPRAIRHYYHPPSNMELFFQEIPKPPYAFPGYTFKRWLNYPLDQKLPQYYPFPKRFAIWTRGILGDSLNCNSTNFKLDDPLLMKPNLAYNPYHDIHTKNYFLNKSVLDRIWELGIINSKGEVKCTMKDFNQHRKYLRDYEWLDECLKRWTDKWVSRLEHNDLTRVTNFELMDWEAKKREYQRKLDRCKANRKVMEKNQIKHNLRIQQKYENSMNRAIEKKNQLQLEMMLRARQRKKEQKLRTKIHLHLQQGRTLFLQRIYADQHKRALRYRKRYHAEKVMEKVERQKESWLRHVEFNRKKMEEMRRIQAELQWEQEMRIQMRRQSAQRAWKTIPLAILHKKERLRKEAERIKKLTSKYFYIWLNKTVKNREVRRHAVSGSRWDSRNLLTKEVHHLTALSGHMNVQDELFAMIRKKIRENKLSGQSQETGEEPKKKSSGSLGSIRFGSKRDNQSVEDEEDDGAESSIHQKVFDFDENETDEDVDIIEESKHHTEGYEADLDDDDD